MAYEIPTNQVQQLQPGVYYQVPSLQQYPPQIAQPTYLPPPTTVAIAPPPMPRDAAPGLGKYGAAYLPYKTTSIVLGTFFAIAAAVSIVGGCMAMVYHASLWEIGTGIWCGAMYACCAGVSIAAGVHLTDPLIQGSTATSFFGFLFGIAEVTITSIALCEDLYGYYCYDPYYYNCNNYYYYRSYAIAAQSLMIAAGSIAIIFGFWLFIVGCIAVCNPSHSATQVSPMPIYIPNQPILAHPSQQPILQPPVTFVPHVAPHKQHGDGDD